MMSLTGTVYLLVNFPNVRSEFNHTQFVRIVRTMCVSCYGNRGMGCKLDLTPVFHAVHLHALIAVTITLSLHVKEENVSVSH